MTTIKSWLQTHDPGYGATRRATRAAILMPSLLAFVDKVLNNPVMSYFVAFGCFAMLLLVDFSGSRLDRVRAQTLLAVACAVLISIGTLVSQSTVLSVITMLVVAFVVLFSGVVSSVIASATTPLVLALILPITVPGPASQIPERIAGWGIAGAVSLVAITFLWPSSVAFPVEGRAAAACRAVGVRIRAEIAWLLGEAGTEADATFEQARAASAAAIAALDKLFLGTPYRPTGLSTQARAEIRLVDELRWLHGVVLHSGPRTRPTTAPNQGVCDVKLAAAAVLECAADALEQHRSGTAEAAARLQAAREQLDNALRALETRTLALADERRAAAGDGRSAASTVVSALDPSFRAQEMAYITGQIAANVDFAVAASGRSWLDRLLGRQPAGFTGAFTSAWERALAHAELTSSWLHNSLRGASGLAVAVLVADLTSVQHGFWVVFGTLAVLRSNALSTGQNVVRALAGTTVGFVIGGLIVWLVGTNTAVLWVILPLAVLCAGMAPATISFAAGQAAFTLTLLVLFNLLVPVGWRLGLIRVEDVAIGGAVSLAVGVLFWPRGAGADLGRALGRAYVESTNYLAEAVAYGVACCSGPAFTPTAPRALAADAAAAARRLDDTFRGYLAERGAKLVPLAEVTTLVTGVAGVRLAADAVVELWSVDGEARNSDGDREAARRELLGAASSLTSWFDRFAASLAGAAEVPDPLPADGAADERLVDAVSADLTDAEGRSTAVGVRVIWTGDHLDAVRRLQETLVAPARAAVAARQATAG